MLRVESEDGWWLITHPDHAHLAGEFAAHWGNTLFAAPEPRAHVLFGISVHDDGWAARDLHPVITREGKPSAFSHELVGRYSAFEEIDLPEYLAVRERAVEKLETVDRYAALLVSLHTYNLLTAHADRTTISAAQLPLLDEFLDRQQVRLERLRTEVRRMPDLEGQLTSEQRVLDNFHLLQATDNLSLLSCVDYRQPSTLLHPLRKLDGGASPVKVTPVGHRSFVLDPYPFAEPHLTFHVRARHVRGKTFTADSVLQARFSAAESELLTITVAAQEPAWVSGASEDVRPAS
ncbi:MAG: DUF3891 family protein [Acidobacteriota bacterium]|nr:DUF3891 family protein [Acidobacteriota bacterium]